MNSKRIQAGYKAAEKLRKQDVKIQAAKQRHQLALEALTKWAMEHKVRCSLIIEDIKSKVERNQLPKKDVVRILAIDSWYQHKIQRELKRCGKLRLSNELLKVLPGETRNTLMSILLQGKYPAFKTQTLEKEFQRQRPEIEQQVKSL